jgi:hypothetical protein
MTMIEIRTAVPREKTVLERINEKETVYICYNPITEEVLFGTPSYGQALRFSRINNCEFSIHPPNCYTPL